MKNGKHLLKDGGVSLPELAPLKRDGYAAAYGAGGLDHVDGTVVLPHHGDIAFGQEVVEIQEGFDVGGEDAHPWNWLAQD